MVLILTCWAQEQEEGQGDSLRKQATDSHKLLCQHMSQDVRILGKKEGVDTYTYIEN